MDADEWNDEWRSALAAQKPQPAQAPRLAGGFMILGDPEDARDDVMGVDRGEERG